MRAAVSKESVAVFTHQLHNGNQSSDQLHTHMVLQPCSFGTPITTTLLVSVTSRLLVAGPKLGANSTSGTRQSAALALM